MISYQIDNGNTFARVFCDVCRKAISDEGLVHCNESGEISYSHIGECDRKIKRTPASSLGSERLTLFFARLLRNVRIGPKELEQAEPYLTDDGFTRVVTSRRKLDRVR